MTTSDIGLSTADGASNNKKAHRVLNISDKLKICGPHQLQRCVEKGLGTSGTKEKSTNPKLRSLIGRASKMSASFHTSVITRKRLEESQLADGIPASQVKTTMQQHAIRWGGFLRMFKRDRVLEKHIKRSLTGSESGLCEEDLVSYDLASDTAAQAIEEVIPGSDSEDDNAAESDESDLDLIEEAEAQGKSFPLQHRCISSAEWRQAAFVESLLSLPYEVSQALQGHEGVGLDKEYVLAHTLYENLNQSEMEVVKGSGVNETWDLVPIRLLPKEVQQARNLIRDEVKARFMRPDRHTLLAIKMNPSLDTTATGTLLNGKVALIELMDNEYDRCLIAREKQWRARLEEPVGIEKEGGDSSVLTGAAGAAEPTDSTTASGAGDKSPSTESAVQEPIAKRRRKSLWELTAQVQVATHTRGTSETVIPSALQQEKELYISLARDPELLVKFKNTKTREFDLLGFWEKNKSVLPIHNLVFRGDVGPKKAASANVEFVFSAAGSLLADYHANRLSHGVMEQYMVVGGNWKFPWLRPTMRAIQEAYKKMFGFCDTKDRELPDLESELEGTDGAGDSTEPPVIALE
ncbi:hypothetical protein CYMTET_35838 [Cymbomonas tetramitiformis]|nr:hypothetical protein CYMTET_43704 [Cymbomonas tetramitiformis]KAK3254965.1 hypothetical protein CYMTET_35838 [Cymbomonas tetramitiformis]